MDDVLSPIALTCGDPSGIGPEIACKAWMALRCELPFFLIGDPRHLPNDAAITIIEDPKQAVAAMQTGLPVLPHSFAGLATPGAPSPGNAAGVVKVIELAVDLVTSGQASAICTAPISKKELVDHAGFKHPGHTEFLAGLAGVVRVVMLLASDELKVVPATIHIPLSAVPEALTAKTLRAPSDKSPRVRPPGPGPTSNTSEFDISPAARAILAVRFRSSKKF